MGEKTIPLLSKDPLMLKPNLGLHEWNGVQQADLSDISRRRSLTSS